MNVFNALIFMGGGNSLSGYHRPDWLSAPSRPADLTGSDAAVRRVRALSARTVRGGQHGTIELRRASTKAGAAEFRTQARRPRAALGDIRSAQRILRKRRRQRFLS